MKVFVGLDPSESCEEKSVLFHVACCMFHLAPGNLLAIFGDSWLEETSL